MSTILNTALKPVKALAGAIMGTGPKVNILVEKQRLNACLRCDLLYKPTMRCKKCKCFVEEKVKFADGKCPLKKW